MNTMNRHSVIDMRLLELHTRVREHLIKSPLAVRQVAAENLARWKAAGVECEALEEWEVILEGTDEEVAAFLIDFTERAIRLRQSSPFPGVLSEDERLRVFERYAGSFQGR